MRRKMNPETDGRTSPARRKEVLHRFGALLRQNAAENIDAMIESRVGQYIEARMYRAALRVIAPVDEARDPRLDHGSRAHGTGLNGYVRRGTT
jgi:acyl-CoA reductase-like NAD-dependent aldehyde dehydrogenase